jgi:heptosyltransferase-2
VAVRAPNWLGDTVMALPALTAIRAAWPEARITVVGRWATLLSGQGVADVLLPHPGGRDGAGERRAIRRAMAASGVDLAVLFAGSFEAALSAWRWGARRRVGFDTDARSALLTEAIPLPSPRLHQIDEYLSLIGALGIEAPARSPRFTPRLDGAAEREVAGLLESVSDGRRRLVGLHLGAAGGPAKRWPVISFARLAGRLVEDELAVVLLGGPDDEGRAAEVLAAARPRPASLVGRDRPALLPHLLTRLACLVSGDTGVSHLAAALGVPTVSLFGPTDPALTAPRGDGTRSLVGAAPCAPCFLSSCPIDHVCLRSITAEAVAVEVGKAARREASRP